MSEINVMNKNENDNKNKNDSEYCNLHCFGGKVLVFGIIIWSFNAIVELCQEEEKLRKEIQRLKQEKQM
jgi:hypothetical protein